VAGDARAPVYIMNIQGVCGGTLEELGQALAGLGARGISVEVRPLDLLIG
jgi:glycine cleavage system transcriptional repressor